MADRNEADALFATKRKKQQEEQAAFTTVMGAGSKSEPITGDPNKMDFATYKKWREQNQ